MKYFYAIILVFFVNNTSFSAELGGLNGMVPIGIDLNKEGNLMVVVGYGKNACDGKTDGITVYQAGLITHEVVMQHCGLYKKESAEAVTIIRENPLRVMVSAEGYGWVYYCDFDLENKTSICKKNYYSVFKHGELREISGMDISKDGLLFAVFDNASKIYRLSEGCLYQEPCRIEDRIYLPKYLSQAEDLDVNRCPRSEDECIYIADIGKGGTGTIYYQNLVTDEWFRKKISIKKDAESFSTFDTGGNVYGILIYKDREGTARAFKM